MKPTSARNPRRKDGRKSLLRRRGGQAMVEYALLSVLMLAGVGGSIMIFLPNMIRAYNIYHQSFYKMLNLPIP